VYGSHIVSGLAYVFAGMALLFLGLSVVYSLVFVPVAFVFGAAAYFVWYHASGRMAGRLYRGVENRAATAGARAGPREKWEAPRREWEAPRREWEAPRGGRRAREAASGGGARTDRGAGEGPFDGRRRRARQRAPTAGREGPTAREAYETLGLDADADEAAVKSAYRERVKEVHPDRPSGDEDEFKHVKAAYERLTD